MLEDLLATGYWCVQLMVEPADAGHAGVARLRTHIYFYHKRTAVCLHDPLELYDQISSKIRRVVSTEPADYMVSSPEARAAFKMRICARRAYQLLDPEAEAWQRCFDSAARVCKIVMFHCLLRV